MKKRYYVPWIVFAAIIIGVIVFFLSWTQVYYKPTVKALSLSIPDNKVDVSGTGNIKFTPKQGIKDTGFIFYPGGKIDERAYSYLGYGLANDGYTAIIAKMPLRLAIFKSGAAQNIIQDNSAIKNWVIGGHSLGGAAAAIFTGNNPGLFKGIVFLASYPANSSDLSSTSLYALSISGSNDEIINRDSLASSVKLLPSETEFFVIEGGNHSQFGDYGFQSGDGVPAITPGKQQEIILNNILQLLARIDQT